MFRMLDGDDVSVFFLLFFFLSFFLVYKEARRAQKAEDDEGRESIGRDVTKVCRQIWRVKTQPSERSTRRQRSRYQMLSMYVDVERRFETNLELETGCLGLAIEAN